MAVLCHYAIFPSRQSFGLHSDLKCYVDIDGQERNNDKKTSRFKFGRNSVYIYIFS